MKLLKYLAIIFFDIIDKFYHQKRIIKFIKSNRLNLNTFLDIGSHLGTYSDLILKDFSNCKIYMFEPQIKIFKKIKIKYKNKKNVKIYNCAISDKNSFKNFYINQHDLTSSLSAMNLKNNTYYKLKSQLFGVTSSGMIVKKLKVKTLALNKILKLNKIKNVDLAKIDTEGHEYEVLQGLKSNIKIVKIILIEFHNDDIFINYNANKIHKYLINNNFYLQEKIKFPFTTWEDRVYINKINL